LAISTAWSMSSIFEDAQHRPEDLPRAIVMSLLTSRTPSPDVVAGAQSVRPPGTAGNHGGALVDALLDQALDLLELRLGSHRSNGRGVVQVADRHLLGGTPRGPRGVVLTGFRPACETARCSSARIRHHRGHAAATFRCELVVVEHDVRTLAAEFLVTRFTVDAALRATSMPARVEPVKDTMFDVGMTRQRDGRRRHRRRKRGCTRRPERLQHP